MHFSSLRDVHNVRGTFQKQWNFLGDYVLVIAYCLRAVGLAGGARDM